MLDEVVRELMKKYSITDIMDALRLYLAQMN